MKTFVVLAVSIVLVSILFCPIAMAFPPLPADLKYRPTRSFVAQELAAFFGKWWWRIPDRESFVIVEKIDEDKASIYVWRIGRGWPEETPTDLWTKHEAKVIKDRGKYTLQYQGPYAEFEYTMKGDHLAAFAKGYGIFYFKRVY